MDQCKHCIIRGDIAACEKTECDKHEYWYVETLRARVARLEEALKEISTLYWVDAPAPEEMRRIARRALGEK